MNHEQLSQLPLSEFIVHANKATTAVEKTHRVIETIGTPELSRPQFDTTDETNPNFVDNTITATLIKYRLQTNALPVLEERNREIEIARFEHHGRLIEKAYNLKFFGEQGFPVQKALEVIDQQLSQLHDVEVTKPSIELKETVADKNVIISFPNGKNKLFRQGPTLDMLRSLAIHPRNRQELTDLHIAESIKDKSGRLASHIIFLKKGLSGSGYELKLIQDGPTNEDKVLGLVPESPPQKPTRKRK